MQGALKILISNWMNIVGIIVTVYFYTFYLVFFATPEHENYYLQRWLFGSLFLIFGYGMMSWIGFLTAIILLDLVLIVPFKRNLTERLLMEWALIVSPFIYWAFKYDYWLWVFIGISFLLTQMLRKHKIEKLEITYLKVKE